MKKYIIIAILFLFYYQAFAQVAIGKSSLSSTSSSLEFGVGNRGIVLPWVTDASTMNSSVKGTLVFDIKDKKVKVKLVSGWRDLSIDNSGVVNTTLQDGLNDLPSAKVMIGKNPSTDTTPGILVLTDENKAMVLPNVPSPHVNIQNPAPGMMVYDTTTHQLAVFNGSVWSFWKP